MFLKITIIRISIVILKLSENHQKKLRLNMGIPNMSDCAGETLQKSGAVLLYFLTCVHVFAIRGHS